MDKLERQLRVDADQLSADVSPALRKRIDAAVAAAEHAKAEPQRQPRLPWWVGVLAGCSVAAVAVVALNYRAQNIVKAPTPDIRADVPAPSPVTWRATMPLEVRNAVLTEKPLEEELEHLKSDLDRARSGVAKDLRASF